ncbi:DNA methyltransferase [Acidipropionibacterium virtanenii]|uniref:site-specific DNA-methyltransferase (adenine-specific) n=1 Tax=Acidipropionibacterium virtanenii TaxID=2057246 RepID=A0A344UU82_9ACTN|nr:DNA methyltransferase [Acidipropionibacterium virtanenii]AXE38830.1 Type IIS restriction enzyme Eco57I [Acidipropionibacterium virtanenii]
MVRAAHRNLRAPSAVQMHRQWLELVDTEGPFLAIPPLKRVWPTGIPDFRSTHPDRFEALTSAHKEFVRAWDSFDRDPEGDGRLDAYRVTRDEWIETLLRDVIRWDDSLVLQPTPAIQVKSPNRSVTVTAQASLSGADGMAAVVLVVDPTDSLRQTPNDLWAATPIDRCEALLRENQVEIGIVTDGRWWGLVCAAAGRMAASGIVDALTWVEEPRTRDAFLALLGRQYLIGGEPDERLPKLFADSVAESEEITEALGAQVRRAVELLIQSFSESAADAKRRGMPSPLPGRTHDIYEAAVTVMMRTVFLLFAEERGLLPAGELFEQGYGMAGVLDKLASREINEGEESLDATSRAWHRLLSTSRALFAGASFENLRMPAYGGSLFDPDRFPFLTATTEQGSLAVTVPDRVMLHILRSVQIAHVKGEARRISFRDIDVEQIGYIYEGLLGYTCTTVDETYLGLLGKSGSEPEIPLAELEALAGANPDPKKLAAAIREWVKTDQPSATPSSSSAIAKAIKAEPDATAVSALTQVVGDDYELRDRIKPWLGLIRRDLRQYPFVVPAGGLLVKETPSRKNSGAHYTPRSLAEEVVLHALQPLCYAPGPHQTADESAWKLKSSDELLELKVADIACGSGAFLVAAARYLADRVVEAWISEDPANTQRKNLRTRAIRQVVSSCLYGADINDMAVEMCKLSLWLVSLDPNLPFSFVDDKVFLGNSLLGLTDFKQLRSLHIDPLKAPSQHMFDMFDVDVDSIINRAVTLRENLASPVDDADPVRSNSAKRRQLKQLRDVTADLRKLADGVIAVGLPLGGKPGRALDAAYQDLRVAAKRAYPGPHGETADSSWLDTTIDNGLTPSVDTDYRRWQPLHWVIEAADVMVGHGGFDAIIGNPPFLGGQKLTGAMGTSVRDWFVNVLADGRRGSADLVAYFFLRATSLLQRNGTLGLIATNTVAQGDTREVGLDAMVADGFTITRAIQSRSWPAASANLEYAAVWGALGLVAEEVSRVADDAPVRRISTLLEAQGRTEGNPMRLTDNTGIAFQGCIVLGMGFVVEPEEAEDWIAADARNAEVLFPYLNGEDLNQRPDASPSRWVIDFNNHSEAEAASYALPFARVRELVRPEREKLRGRNSTADDRARNWWKFGRRSPAMRKAIAHLPEMLVIARVSKTVMPLRVSTGLIPSEACVVFASSSYAFQAVLSSSLHQLWAITYGSGMRNDPRYTPSDVFETFPRPGNMQSLTEFGRKLDFQRREIMWRRGLGSTKLYNMVNDPRLSDFDDPDVTCMRELHAELDRAVTDAYGWVDIQLGHGFHTFRKMRRWTVAPAARVELLERLLDENLMRAVHPEAMLSRSSVVDASRTQD